MITDEKQAATVAESARILGVTTSWLYHLASAGALEILDTKPKLIRAEELERLVMERTAGYRPLGEKLRNRLLMDMAGKEDNRWQIAR